MVDYVFIGRRRNLVKVAIYGLLTVGIYGRVLLFKQLKEIDGHRALFLNLPAVGFLLVLPILGPLAVKFWLRRLLVETVHADPTHPKVRAKILAWLALVPILPVFVGWVQHHLNIYWRRQQRISDLAHRKSDLERRSRQRKTAAVQEEIRTLTEEVDLIEKGLRDEDDAARSLREIQDEERLLSHQLKEEERAHRRAKRKKMLGFLRLPKRKKKAKEPKGEAAEGPPTEPAAEEKAAKRKWTAFLRTSRLPRREKRPKKPKSKKRAKE